MITIDDIKIILGDNGICVNDNGSIDEIESIDFIQLIIDIELQFNIEVPDQFLLADNYPTVESLYYMVKTLVDAK